tara:strand:+ start:714 stop:1451 length:738 start_codon:yes stop_codon:yes gene_type:complete
MKSISLIFVSLVLTVGLGLSHAQELGELNTGSVVRLLNCSIEGDYTYDQVVERARALDWGENSPSGVFFRRPIYTTAEYQSNNDLQIAAYYTSFTEMVDKRVAMGANAGGRLPITCGAPSVVRTYAVQPGTPFGDATAMTTRFCSLNEGASLLSAYSRIMQVAGNYASEGDESLVQMNIPALGGPMNPDWDFVIAVVGSSRQGLTDRLDMRRNGFRAEVGNQSSSSFSCNRSSLWGTARIYSANN